MVVVLVAVVVAVAGTVVEVGVAVVTTAEDAVGAAVRQLTVATMIATTARTWFRFNDPMRARADAARSTWSRQLGTASIVACRT